MGVITLVLSQEGTTQGDRIAMLMLQAVEMLYRFICII